MPPINIQNTTQQLLDPAFQSRFPVSSYLSSVGKLTPQFLETIKSQLTNPAFNEDRFISENNIATVTEILQAKSAWTRIPFVDLEKVDSPQQVVQKLPNDIAISQKAVCFATARLDENDPSSETYQIAMVDPTDIQRVRFIESKLDKKIQVFWGEEKQIQKRIDSGYNKDTLIQKDIGKVLENFDSKELNLQADLKSFSKNQDVGLQNAPIARIVNTILEYGVKFKSSDAHIEPRENKISVRFRIHGMLEEKIELPIQIANSLVSRIKILSDLKIDEHRIPQDGRFEAKFGETVVDMRVSIMPTVYGEKIVIRFLDKTSGVFPLEQTGMVGHAYKVFKEALNATQGIILVTGPTGSGKTVTLSSSLGILNKPNVNIVTLEDPVEIRVPGVNQVQVNAEVGLTFAMGLRAFLRQDPDVIMVGEIRDEETAGLAVQAALVGRLVLATLHTNSSAGAIPRLLNMKIEPYLLSSVINCILAQRLPRKVCDNCKFTYEATPEQSNLIHSILDGIKGLDYGYSGTQRNIQTNNLEEKNETRVQGKIILAKGRGCEKCSGTGYSGRIGIFEALKVTDKIAKLIIEHRTAQEIEQVAKEEGMVTMLQDGFLKVLDGITTIEEIMRVQDTI